MKKYDRKDNICGENRNKRRREQDQRIEGIDIDRMKKVQGQEHYEVIKKSK